MSTTERMTELDLAVSRPTPAARLAATWQAMKSVLRALRNRRAANRLADLDDALLRDIGLSRADVESILRTSGIADDPSRLLARTARNRATRSLQPVKSE
ncbi:DUF1127 domain-containing protein [Ciceribacter sp. RN22]|uniref:DUF1127 domain-containing protein n=1 Tax=Ciceribacter sp. RN22 TaxID=2954932 RepID=UPI002092C103|nr:DUF1127 domain-containing protein [Ciceribacter sp. RN22]MCO6177187.1 DUF1127 domain-containing protein [Ciceribacter sp. RN22]